VSGQGLEAGPGSGGQTLRQVARAARALRLSVRHGLLPATLAAELLRDLLPAIPEAVKGAERLCWRGAS